MKSGWKNLVKELCAQHNLEGTALVGEGGEPVAIDFDPFPECYTTGGDHLDERAVQRWLWEQREVLDAVECVWSVLEAGVSFVGLGVRKGADDAGRDREHGADVDDAPAAPGSPGRSVEGTGRGPLRQEGTGPEAA